MLDLTKTWKPFAAGLAMLSLAACAGTQLDAAKGVTPTGDEFSTNLYKEYIALSQAEYDEGDYEDSDAFATRAMASAAGTPPAPEELSARQIPEEHAVALTGARADLMLALSNGAAANFPGPAASAQAGFDCWMQEAEENIQDGHIEACKAKFDAAMAQIGTPEPAGISFANYTVYFALDSAVVSDEAMAELRDAAITAKTMPASTINIAGYTDRSGSASYNLALSERRAQAVEAALQGLLSGIDAVYTLEAFGENQNKVVTPDGVVNEKNRRVKVEIRK